MEINIVLMEIYKCSMALVQITVSVRLAIGFRLQNVNV